MSSKEVMNLKEVEAASLPVIDFGLLDQHLGHRSLVIEDIRKACQGLGCFKIVNHGITSSIMKDALEAASDFFNLSKEEKAEYASDDIHRPVRYSMCSKDGTIKPRDFLKQYAHPLSEWSEFWPHSPANYRQKMGKYAMEVRRVALQLKDAIMESLGLGQGYMVDKMEAGMQIMTVNNYDKSPAGPGSTLGFVPHSDYGCITIILQSSEGLQIVDRSVDEWRAVPEFPDALHVHLGDYFEILSNGLYKTVVHRVILNSQKRMSIASIHALPMDEIVAPAEELVDEQHPKGYKDSCFREFLHYTISHGFGNGDSYINSLRILAP